MNGAAAYLTTPAGGALAHLISLKVHQVAELGRQAHRDAAAYSLVDFRSACSSTLGAASQVRRQGRLAERERIDVDRPKCRRRLITHTTD
ncbi:hypothetical protein THF1C08_330050 [Vibrio jasicida]|uniref:Uncharacterized protein n=1 Tax=Vibrio jasicida TaxID=766224 RepID=A0AAU9QPJ1_9VIBR|nr:hypothetical protein THF1C08_330050 [Vibrio jasicida]CAH1597744.1 hypothetical protein THF1A12_330052 [Vibrio jasicida]